jgi:hypothetical protein
MNVKQFFRVQLQALFRKFLFNINISSIKIDEFDNTARMTVEIILMYQILYVIMEIKADLPLLIAIMKSKSKNL